MPLVLLESVMIFHVKVSFCLKLFQKLADLRLSFDYLPRVHLLFWLLEYHWSNLQSVKCTCITLYNKTVHCTIRTRFQSIRRQHRRRTSEKSETVTYKDSSQVATNRWVAFIGRLNLSQTLSLLNPDQTRPDKTPPGTNLSELIWDLLRPCIWASTDLSNIKTS